MSILLVGLAKLLMFLAFWFAAPEILGEDRLRRYTKSGLIVVALAVSLTAWVALIALLGVYGYNEESTRHPPQTTGDAVTRVRNIVQVRIMAVTDFWTLVFCIAAAVAIFTSLKEWIDKQISKLAESERMRRVGFILAAWFFLIGSGLDFGIWSVEAWTKFHPLVAEARDAAPARSP